MTKGLAKCFEVAFKTIFYRFLAREWSKNSYADLIKDHQIYFDNIYYHFSAPNVNVLKIVIQELESDHEE